MVRSYNNPAPLLAILLILTICLLLIDSSSVAAIEYVENSMGLIYPEWDAGRSEIAMVDIDGDGDIDLLSVGDHGSAISEIHGIMVYSLESGWWSLFQSGDFGYGGIAVGDCNNDGFLDVGYGIHHNYSSDDFGDQMIEVALGAGNNWSWTPWDDGLAENGETNGMFGVDFGDFDNDGDLDIAAGSFGPYNKLMVYRNQMDGSWVLADSLSGGNPGYTVEFGDINNDGNLDIASTYEEGSMFFGTGTGKFHNNDNGLPLALVEDLADVSLGDVNNDGAMDLAYGDYANGILIYTWDIEDTIWTQFGFLPIFGTYENCELCDLNSDGFCDIAVTTWGTVKYWTGNGSGVWTSAGSYVIENDPDCAFKAFNVGGDIDHNGYPDIVHLTGEGQYPSVINQLRVFMERSTADSLTIQGIYPHGSENFLGGSVRFIDWCSEVPAGETSEVDLEFSCTGAFGPWMTIAAGIPNNGHCQWTIPDTVLSSECFIKYTVATAAGMAETTTISAFSIFPTESLTAVELTPLGTPIVIPPEGGTFEYEVNILSTAPILSSFDFWIDMVMPDGSLNGPVYFESIFNLGAGDSLFWQMEQVVPDTDPGGTYTYQAQIGVQFNNFIWDMDTFTFEKESDSQIGLSADTLIFEDTIVGETDSLPLVIYNPGEFDLILYDITTGAPEVFTVNWNPADTIITSGDSLNLEVMFSPQDTTLYNEYLTIENNAQETNVYMTGWGIPGMSSAKVPLDHPLNFALLSAYPNPFNPETKLRFTLQEDGQISLKVYNIHGREIAIIEEGFLQAGYHEAVFEGVEFSSGIYFAKLTAGGFQQTQKLLLIK